MQRSQSDLPSVGSRGWLHGDTEINRGCPMYGQQRKMIAPHTDAITLTPPTFFSKTERFRLRPPGRLVFSLKQNGSVLDHRFFL
ncbi:hypothetical protein [Moorena sp. SIO3I8]|uniref:hypothetical protein n=1 Tax=Moorena sp. SIO3I8 TaxID=2607833 RepID=UPI0013C25DF8|nr:hypothetical protein [Moorena sp. SIO3I8]NEO08759.1 hypothetical protein [Moorena sp. SIO3I8]